MAELSVDQLLELRRCTAKDFDTVGWTKTEINAAIQALEDWWQSANGRAAAGAAMNTAVPGVFSNPELKSIGKWFFHHTVFKAGG